MPRELRECRASCGNRVLLLGRSETAAFTGAEAQRDQIAPINNKENAILAAELGQWNRQSGSAAAVVPRPASPARSKGSATMPEWPGPPSPLHGAAFRSNYFTLLEKDY